MIRISFRNVLMMALAGCAVFLGSCGRDDAREEDEPREEDKIVVASGVTGECEWELSGDPGDYTLAVEGEGAMKNYDPDRGPWTGYRDEIKTLIIGEGVTVVGDYAFQGFGGLTGVTIPNSVTGIGNFAFRDCGGLISASIGSSVTTIHYGTFMGCGGLISIDVDAANTLFSSADGVLFNKEKTRLLVYPEGRRGEYAIPVPVTEIDAEAFSGCAGLTGVTIPVSVTAIGARAFRDCGGLTSARIGNSVTTIGDAAFQGCSGLTSVTIPASVTGIGKFVFAYCRGLTSIHVEEANTRYASADGVLFNKGKTTLLDYPEGREGVYEIPGSVDKIGFAAFCYCDGLTGVTLPGSVIAIDEWAFSGCGGLTGVGLPGSVVEMHYTAFTGCDALTTFTSLGLSPPVVSLATFFWVGASDCTLRVPASAVEAYKGDLWWGKFGKIVGI